MHAPEAKIGKKFHQFRHDSQCESHIDLPMAFVELRRACAQTWGFALRNSVCELNVHL